MHLFYRVLLMGASIVTERSSDRGCWKRGSGKRGHQTAGVENAGVEIARIWKVWKAKISKMCFRLYWLSALWTKVGWVETTS